MPSIQIKGPKSQGSPLVSYQTVFSRSQGQQDHRLDVTIRLGDKLRHLTESPRHQRLSTPTSRPLTKDGASKSPASTQQPPSPGNQKPLRIRRTRTPQESPPSPSQTPPARPTRRGIRIVEDDNVEDNSKHNVEENVEDNVEQTGQTTENGHNESNNYFEQNNQPDQDSSESDLEILEVKELPPRYDNPWGVFGQADNKTTYDKNSDDTDSDNKSYSQSDSDLSSLEEAIIQETDTYNNLPNSNVPTDYRNNISEAVSKFQVKAPLAPHLKLPIQQLIPSLYAPVKVAEGPLPPGYRNIPPNLIYAIQRELNGSHAVEDDDLEVVEKMTFSLKDPITRTKINLPIKATTCRHLECFDFNNFCLFHNVPPGIKHSLKQTLLLQSKESRALEAQFLRQQNLIAEGKLPANAPGLVYPYFSHHGQLFFTQVFNKTAPLYKCPLCDEKFGLKQLYISDIVNYFVKTTPRSIVRIELIENSRYKIIEDELAEEKNEHHEVVSLSGEESDGEVEPKTEGDENGDTVADTTSNDNNDVTNNDSDFNDGLDAVLSSLGDGSWAHPVTLD